MPDCPQFVVPQWVSATPFPGMIPIHLLSKPFGTSIIVRAGSFGSSAMYLGCASSVTSKSHAACGALPAVHSLPPSSDVTRIRLRGLPSSSPKIGNEVCPPCRLVPGIVNHPSCGASISLWVGLLAQLADALDALQPFKTLLRSSICTTPLLPTPYAA